MYSTSSCITFWEASFFWIYLVLFAVYQSLQSIGVTCYEDLLFLLDKLQLWTFWAMCSCCQLQNSVFLLISDFQNHGETWNHWSQVCMFLITFPTFVYYCVFLLMALPLAVVFLENQMKVWGLLWQQSLELYLAFLLVFPFLRLALQRYYLSFYEYVYSAAPLYANILLVEFGSSTSHLALFRTLKIGIQVWRLKHCWIMLGHLLKIRGQTVLD